MDMDTLSNTLFKKYISVPNLHQKYCIFTMGLPASGKTTNSKLVLEKLDIHKNKIIHLDPDIVMEDIKQNSSSSNLSTLNRNSVIVTSKIFDKIVTNENKYSLIYYGTGKSWSSYRTMINKAKKNGYKTILINVILDLETAIRRNTLRGRNGGRSVGSTVISNIHNRLTTPLSNSKTPKKYLGKTNFEILKSLVDETYVLDNSRNTPSILAQGKNKSVNKYKNRFNKNKPKNRYKNKSKKKLKF